MTIHIGAEQGDIAENRSDARRPVPCEMGGRDIS